MSHGWIKLHRKLIVSSISDNPNTLCVWVHLLLKATHKEHTQIVGRQSVRLMPGQLIFGRKSFSKESGLSENVIRGAMDILAKLNQITTKPTNRFSVVSIVNWGMYQNTDTDTTSKPPTDSQQIASRSPADSHKQEGLEWEEGKEKPLTHSVSERKAPDCPHQKIADLYNQILPELSAIFKINDARRKKLSATWKSDKRFQSLEFWEKYFNKVRTVDGYMTKTPNWEWTANFDWLINQNNVIKVIEGQHE